MRFVLGALTNECYSQIICRRGQKRKTNFAEKKTLKRTTAAFKAAHPYKQVFAVRRDRTVSIDWVPTAKVTSTAKDTDAINWNQVGVDQFTVNKLDIIQKFNDTQRTPAAGVEWSQ